MKGKRTCKEKILAFMLSFVVTAGMVMETVQLQAAESGPVREQTVADAPAPSEEPFVEENSGMGVFSAGDDGEAQPREEKKAYEIMITAPDGPFYIGETCEAPFKATVREIAGDTIIEDPSIEWFCTTSNGVIDAAGKITVNAGGEIGIAANYKDPDTGKILGVSTPWIINGNTVKERPRYNITGIVQDIYNDEPVCGAKADLISWEDGDAGKIVDTVYTGDNGDFILKDVKGGKGTEYKITISKEGRYNTKEIRDLFTDLEEDFDLGHIKLETSDRISLEEIHEGESIDLKVGEEKTINVICPKEWQREITLTPENDHITAIYRKNGQITLNGVKEGTAGLKVSAHGQEFRITVNVERYGNITGLISIIEQSESYYVNDTIHMQAQFFSNDVFINDADKKVSFTVFYPDGTVHPANPEFSGLTDGTAVASFTFPYKGSYTFSCTLEADEKYEEDCTISVTVDGIKPLEGQKITYKKEQQGVIGTYGESINAAEKIEFEATIAGADKHDLEKGWEVTSDDNAIEDYTVIIDKNCIEQKEKGLFDISGYIYLKPSKAGRDLNLKLTYRHTDHEEQKVYKDAEAKTTFSIDQKLLRVKGITFEDKIYDGTASAGIKEVTFHENDIAQNDRGKVAANIEGRVFQLASASRDAPENIEEGTSYLLWEDEIEGGQGSTGTITLDDPEMNDNYLIVKDENIGEKGFICEIKRRPIYLKVSDGTREYGMDLLETQKKAEVLSCSGSDRAGLLDGDQVGERITVADTSLPETLVKKDAYEGVLKPVISDGNMKNRHAIIENKDMEVKSANKNYCYKIGEDDQGNPLFGDLTVTKRSLTDRNIHDFMAYDGDIFTDPEEDKLWVRGNLPDNGTAFGIWLKINSDDPLFDAIKITEVSPLGGKERTKAEYDKESGDNRKIFFHTLQEIDGAGQKIVFTLYKGNTCCSEPYTQTVYVDSKAPEVRFENLAGENTPLDSIIGAISFGNYKNTSFSVPVTVQDGGSGERNYDQTVLDVKDDISKEELCAVLNGLSEDDWEKGSEGVPISVGKGKNEESVEGYYVAAVRTYDNLGNTLIYGSNGIVIENKEPFIRFPDDLDHRYGQEYLNKAIEIDNIVVTDYDVKETEYVSSGISKIQYVIYQGTEENKITESTVYSAREGIEYTYERLGDKGGEPLKITFKGKLDIKNLGDKEKLLADHNDVYLKVMATDHSGKTVSAIRQLIIDLSSPEIEVHYSNAPNTSTQNEIYFNGNRKAVLSVKDRNIVPGQIYFKLSLMDKELRETYTLDPVSIEQLRALTDATPKHQKVFDSISTELKDLGDGVQQMDIAFIFNGEDRYEVNFTCADGAGNENEGIVYSSDAAEAANNVFVIDKTRPVLRQVYTSDGMEISRQPEETDYVQTPVCYTVYIDEHNFAGEGLDFGAASNTEISRNTDGIWSPDALMRDSSQWTENGVNGAAEQWKYTFTFEAQGVYRHFFAYKDLAGNPAVYMDADGNEISNTDTFFTIDRTRSTGSVSVNGFGFWETLLHNITFGLFCPNSVDVEMETEDRISPLYAVQYFRTPDPMTLEQLEDYDWSKTEDIDPCEDGYRARGKFTVNPDEQFVVYMKVTDYADNVSYFSSDGMIVDSARPAPAVTITNLSQSQNGIFNKDVILKIDAEDPYAGDTYSGLERVWYTISASGNVNASETIELLDNSSSRVQSSQTFSQVVTVPANVYNSNDVRIQAFAADFSGNQGKSEITKLKIDVTNPSISVSWDLNKPLNGSYYKDTRTATVTITDRNFDPDNVRFCITNTDGTKAGIGRWSSSRDIGVSDSAVSTCQVAFPADGDYTFTLECTDLAGNSAGYDQMEKFTIDKTVPEISVFYDNNRARNENYYNETRTATVTVREHNFNPADVKAAITASLQGKGMSPPTISGFSGRGDVHTATVTYGTDGDYTFDVEYTDMAGNKAADYVPDDFTVDLTDPKIKILDVEDKSANNDVVSPRIRVTDVNYDAENVSVTITGANNGQVNIDKVVSAVKNGQVIKFKDFVRKEKMDDLYTLTAKAVDMAGNEKEASIFFSVNRYGSVYVLDDDTKDWLRTKDYVYINGEKAVGIMEYNVDSIENRQITVNRDGEMRNLKEKIDYKVTSSQAETQWKENHYILAAENFATEGNYSVIFSTRDKAGNAMNNTSVKRSSQNLPVEFAVDKTAPTVVVSGVEDGGSYRSAERIMTVDAKDNLALNEVTITIDGKKRIYKAKELAKTQGIIDVVIAGANNFREIKITASDAAGNVLGQKQVNGKGQPAVLSILVTPNILVQYYMNKPFFYGSIIAAAVTAGVIGFLMRKKKK